MSRVAATGETRGVTLNGRPSVELLPYCGESIDSPFGLYPGLEINGAWIPSIEQPF